MDIDRNKEQGGISIAIERVKFCLDQLEKAEFDKGIDWDTRVTDHLNIEEMIGALVSAGQELNEQEDEE